MTASPLAGPRRSSSDIRVALAKHAPAEIGDFEREFQSALKVAAATYDTGPIEEVLDQWWRVAVLRTITLSEEEQDQLRRAEAGDFTGLWENPPAPGLDTYLALLAKDPIANARYDPNTDRWSSDFDGGLGLCYS